MFLTWQFFLASDAFGVNSIDRGLNTELNRTCAKWLLANQTGRLIPQILFPGIRIPNKILSRKIHSYQTSVSPGAFVPCSLGPLVTWSARWSLGRLAPGSLGP